MTYIDVHCHIEMLKAYQDSKSSDMIKNSKKDEKVLDMIKDYEVKDIVERAKKKNVEIVASGVNVESNKKVLGFADEFGVKISLGMYPTDTLKLSGAEVDAELEMIRKNAEKIAFIGEVGLDFKECTDKKEQARQEENFRKVIQLAKEIDKPLLVHSRKAEERCVEILEEECADKVIMHCFSGKLKLVPRVLENGWHISIPTSVKNSEHFQKIIELAELDKLLCETDSPFLHPDKKFPNLPENVIVSYEKIAEIKGIKVGDVEEMVEKNFEGLIG